MPRLDWDELIGRMEFTRRPSPKPSADACVEFERQSGFLDLPPSYREFCERFGPGTAGYLVDIAVPGYPELGWQFDLALCHADYRDRLNYHDWVAEVSDEDRDLFERLIVFGSDVASTLYGWDPDDIRDASGPEFSIYAVTREFELYRVADSFFMFVDEFCCGESQSLLYAPGDEEVPPHFDPAYPPL